MKGTPSRLKSRRTQRTQSDGPAGPRRSCLVAFIRPRGAVAALLAAAAALACGKGATQPPPPGAVATKLSFTVQPSSATAGAGSRSAQSVELGQAVRTRNFWLILAACTLTIGAIGAVTQHLILFLKDHGYSQSAASRVSSTLLISSLAGRVIVGYFADRYRAKNVMALFYLALALAIPLIFFANRPAAIWGFALAFGFAMGADYMLIPLVTAECFGLATLGKLLSLIIMGYSLGQWFAPWLAGRIFDTYHNYDLAWAIMAVAATFGAGMIYAVTPEHTR